jgi:hypothetical protein
MDAVSGATERPCPHRIRVVTHEYEDIYGRSTQNAKLFQSVISPKAAVNLFFAGFAVIPCHQTLLILAKFLMGLTILV